MLATQEHVRRPFSSVRRLVFCALPLVVLVPGLSQAQESGDVNLDVRGTDISQMVAHRDHTRVGGLILDSSGGLLRDVDLWIMNDIAPAERYRAKSRKSGSYLLRNLGKLFSRDDTEDIVFRVLFQKNGYQSVRATVRVVKNHMGRVNAVLYREDEDLELDGVCVVVEGVVVTGRGKSVKGAKVIVSSFGGETLMETETESGGSYRAILWDAPDEVRIRVSKDGLLTESELELRTPEFVDVIYPQIHDLILE